MSGVLLVDDEPIVRDLIEEILADAGHDVIATSSAEAALKLMDDPAIELVVSDIVMPGLSGIDLLDEVRRRRASLPVVLVTGAGTHANFVDALGGGADGIVMKPFRHAELRQVVSAALSRASRTEREVRERVLTPTLAAVLANAIEARADELTGHCERLAALAVRMAERLSLSLADVESVRLGAILHDVGKIGIPDPIYTKPGPLTSDELALMRTHPLIGDRLLEPLALLDPVRTIVRHHHERWDGDGYPHGLAGAETPLTARIVALADSVEAMSIDRPYRNRLSKVEIVAEITRGAGGQWDPALAQLLLELISAGELQFGPDGVSVGEDEPTSPARTHDVASLNGSSP